MRSRSAGGEFAALPNEITTLAKHRHAADNAGRSFSFGPGADHVLLAGGSRPKGCPSRTAFTACRADSLLTGLATALASGSAVISSWSCYRCPAADASLSLPKGLRAPAGQGQASAASGGLDVISPPNIRGP